MLNNSSKSYMLNVSDKPFKSRIEPAVWKKMSPEQRNAHKMRQAAFIKSKLKTKVKLILNKYPRGYATTYRKTAKRNSIVTMLNPRVVEAIKKSLKANAYCIKKIQSAREVSAWKQFVSLRGFKIIKRTKNTLNVKNSSHLFGVFQFPARKYVNFSIITANKFSVLREETNKLIYWDTCLPTYYCYPLTSVNAVFDIGNYVYIFNEFGSIQISKNAYGSLLILHKELIFNLKKNLKEYEVLKTNCVITTNAVSSLKENSVIRLYSTLVKQHPAKALAVVSNSKLKFTKAHSTSLEKRSYIKHIVRMRYRWFFQPKLSQFKLFKKFFKRRLKGYRKINKNKLFINKFRSHLPKLTGFTEKGLLRLWLPFRRNYNQYWSASNAVLRFSQSLLLTPASFLVFLQLSPSFAASKHIIKSGAVSINGLAITSFTRFRPGDIMQLNFVIWRSVRHFFEYQRWNNDFRSLQYIPFLQIDWSSLMFMMTRWPRKYELVAPSFLSERWVRYYIRQFPSKIRNFKKASGNWKVYKRIITKR